MTGFGDARRRGTLLDVAVEVRTVNNRYFKVLVKLPESYGSLESEIERSVRELISRGTVTVAIRVDSTGSDQKFHMNTAALEAYWRQICEFASAASAAPPADVSPLLSLPDVAVPQDRRDVNPESDWREIRPVLEAALQNLQKFRVEEGRSMAEDLERNCQLIAERLGEIALIAPRVVTDYRDRLQLRLRDLLAGSGIELDQSSVLREISVFADRCDINEEITRLRCHIDQFRSFTNDPQSMGRKLDFLSQEMFREVNTIGSKANNVEIAHHVVEMKSCVERIREVLQNVE